MVLSPWSGMHSLFCTRVQDHIWLRSQISVDFKMQTLPCLSQQLYVVSAVTILDDQHSETRQPINKPVQLAAGYKVSNLASRRGRACNAAHTAKLWQTSTNASWST